jgi:hypothetical protein
MDCLKEIGERTMEYNNGINPSYFKLLANICRHSYTCGSCGKAGSEDIIAYVFSIPTAESVAEGLT